MTQILVAANRIRKALIAAASVATVLLTVDGVPADAKAWIVKALAVLAAGGITYKVPNKA
jgi:hypothetical protein